ncbi:reverse transcriptase [Trichonephila clavipes]|nr:reverse transcriptase [Trichonephila clavipes]
MGNSGLFGSKPEARFRLTTGHDVLRVYPHWLDLAANEACLLCGHSRMDGDYLLQCTALDEYPTDDNVSWYWEARRQMVKKPSTGVGYIIRYLNH